MLGSENIIQLFKLNYHYVFFLLKVLIKNILFPK